MKPSNPLQMVRRDDPHTSRDATVGASERSPSQKIRLLLAYAEHPDGLTDEEAGFVTGLIKLPKCSYWKRCGELEAEGFLARTLFTRPGVTGNQQMIRQITPAGLAEARRYAT